MVTALDAKEERIKGLEAGADDFLSKPVKSARVARAVRSLLRIRTLYDEVDGQKAELEQWNRTLKQRVADGMAELERLSRMKRFFSPRVAEMITSGDAQDPLKSHRTEITVVFIDLRGYTAFTESAEPEDVMDVLGEYHAEMGRLIMKHNGTIERFAGDAIMIFFNDPIPRGKAKERNHVRPGAAPRSRRGRKLLPPRPGLEHGELGLSGLGAGRGVNGLDRFGQGFAVLPARVLEAVADEVHDAGLQRAAG